MDERLQSFFKRQTPTYDEHLFDVALDRIFLDIEDFLRVEKGQTTFLLPATFSQIYPELNSSATTGYPLFTRKGFAREEAFRDFSRDMRLLRETWNIPVFPCVSSSRNVIRERGKNKPRLVWVYPMHMTVLEAQYALPLVKELVNFPQFGWSFRWNDYGFGVDKFLQNVCVPGTVAFTSDFESFDSTIPRKALISIFKRLEQLFPVNEQSKNVWKIIRNYFCDTPIHHYESIFQKRGGIPSGSYFTSIVGSIMNLAFQYYNALKRRIITVLRHVFTLGDDCLISYHNTDTVDRDTYLDRTAKCAAEFGMKLHPDKSMTMVPNFDTPYGIKFLGMNLTNTWPYIKIDVNEVIFRMALPENRDRTPLDYITRLHGLVWSYGFDRGVYKLLNLERQRVLRMYPSLSKIEISPNSYDPETYRWFRFVIGAGIDISTWPHEAIVYQRYIAWEFRSFWNPRAELCVQLVEKTKEAEKIKACHENTRLPEITQKTFTFLQERDLLWF